MRRNWDRFSVGLLLATLAGCGGVEAANTAASQRGVAIDPNANGVIIVREDAVIVTDDDTGVAPDADPPPPDDSGASPDAGVAPDADPPPPDDSGAPPDAGVTPDADPPPPDDSGMPDFGFPPDADPGPDAGMPDFGFSPDSGPPDSTPDAGVDSGIPDDDAGPCVPFTCADYYGDCGDLSDGCGSHFFCACPPPPPDPPPLDCSTDPTDDKGRFKCLESTGLYGERTSVAYNTRLQNMRNDRPLGPANRVYPYEPQYPLWSDGLGKSRWVLIPSGTSVDATDVNWWSFPNGTKFWKEFSLVRDGMKQTRVETRLIEKTAAATSSTSWKYAAYIWTQNQQQAYLWDERDVTLDGTQNDRTVARPNPVLVRAQVNGKASLDDAAAQNFDHIVPSIGKCNQCHDRGRGTKDVILGFDYIQLSVNVDPNAPNHPATSLVADPLLLDYFWQRRLITQGGGSNAPIVTNILTAAVNQTRARTALGYLHANCANCHNGIRNIGRMNVRFDALLADMPRPDPARQPGWVNTVSRRGRIDPMRPNSSLIYNRMAVKNGESRMPPIATRIVDTAGITAIEQWINSLPRP